MVFVGRVRNGGDVGVSEMWDQEEADYNAARDAFNAKYREEKRKYDAAMAPVKKDYDSAVAAIESAHRAKLREAEAERNSAKAAYAAKIRDAKQELDATIRRSLAQVRDFKLDREARLRIQERGVESARVLLSRSRREAVAHLKRARDEAWKRYHDKRWPLPLSAVGE